MNTPGAERQAAVSTAATDGPISPYSRRLHLGDELRILRQEQDLTLSQLSTKIKIDRTLLTRIETGQRRVGSDQVMLIVESLGVQRHSEQWQQLYEIARDSDTSGWWNGRPFKDLSDRQRLFCDLEAGASRIRWYELSLVPGLLQTQAYIQARHDPDIDFAPVTPSIPASIRAQLRRQQEALRSTGPQIQVVVEETVIRRLMVPKPVMLDQLRHLLTLLDNNPRLELRVLPAGGELLGLRAPRSPILLYEFAAEDAPAVVLESLAEDQLVRDRAEVAHYHRLWQGLHDMAMPEDETRALIAETANELAQAVKGA